MKSRTQIFKVARKFIYLNSKGEKVKECNATKNETIESAIPYVKECENIAGVILIDLTTNEEIGFYKKIIN